MTTWTRETLKTWILEANPENPAHRAALSRALLFLYARQTADEQTERATAHSNGMGFSGIDAGFMSSVAESVKQYGNMTPGQARHIARKLAKYTGQLLEMVTPPAPEPAPGPLSPITCGHTAYTPHCDPCMYEALYTGRVSLFNAVCKSQVPAVLQTEAA